MCDHKRPAFENSVLNTYVPPTIEAMPGTTARGDAILRLLCSDDDRGIYFCTNWLAAKYQSPTRRMGTALVFIDPYQGSGKTTFFRLYREILGVENCKTIGQDELNEKFNAFSLKLFIIANETSGGEDNNQRTHTMNRLKPAITDDRVPLRLMNMNAGEIENRMAIVFTTNDTDYPVTLHGATDRRFSIFRASPVSDEHKRFIAECWDNENNCLSEIGLQEASALAYKLKHWKVDEELLRKPFDNEARDDLIAGQKNFLESFLDDLLEEPGAVLRLVKELALSPGIKMIDANPRLLRASDLARLLRVATDVNGERGVNGQRLGRALKRRGVRRIRSGRPALAWVYAFPLDIFPAPEVEQLKN
jgi:hypothetical protein